MTSLQLSKVLLEILQSLSSTYLRTQARMSEFRSSIRVIVDCSIFIVSVFAVGAWIGLDSDIVGTCGVVVAIVLGNRLLVYKPYKSDVYGRAITKLLELRAWGTKEIGDRKQSG